MGRYSKTTALLVVDVQNDFADPAGSLYVDGGEAAIDAINREIAAAVAAGATVVFTQDWHPEATPHFAKDGGIWPVHCVADTWGAELHPSLDRAEAIAIRKGSAGEDGYSAFTVRDPVTGAVSATPLEAGVSDRGVDSIIVVGLATDYCVKESALDAARLGFATTVLVDAIRAVDLDPGDGARALDEMASAGVVLR